MSSLGKMYAFLIGAGRLGLAAIIATGASLTLGHGVAHAATRGFNIKNLSHDNLVLGSPTVGNWESGPRPGSVLFSGNEWHFELTYFVFQDDNVKTTLTSESGRWSVDVWMKVPGGSGIVTVACYANKGGTNNELCGNTSGIGNNFIPINGAGGGSTIDANTDPTAATNAANLCDSTPCSFKATGAPSAPQLGNYREITNAHSIDNSDKKQPLNSKISITDTLTSTTTLSVTASAQTKIFDAVTVSLSGTASSTTTATKTVSQEIQYTVPPRETLYFLIAPTVKSVTGTLYVGSGGSERTVTNFSSQMIDPTGAPNIKQYALPSNVPLPPKPWTKASLDAYQAKNGK